MAQTGGIGPCSLQKNWRAHVIQKKENKGGLVLKSFKWTNSCICQFVPISKRLFSPYISYILLLFPFCLQTFKTSILIETARKSFWIAIIAKAALFIIFLFGILLVEIQLFQSFNSLHSNENPTSTVLGHCYRMEHLLLILQLALAVDISQNTLQSCTLKLLSFDTMGTRAEADSSKIFNAYIIHRAAVESALSASESHHLHSKSLAGGAGFGSTRVTARWNEGPSYCLGMPCKLGLNVHIGPVIVVAAVGHHQQIAHCESLRKTMPVILALANPWQIPAKVHL